MSKERFLTVLIPINDEDCEDTVYASLAALQYAVPPTVGNINKIYKVEGGTYYRSTFDQSSGTYEYQAVVDREFPYLGNPLEIFDFTYDATRMGTAPTISAQSVMRFAEKENGEDVTLDGLWNRSCHVVFNGEKFYLKNVPTSSKSNEDARYRYDIDFVSETVILENVYFYDVVSPFITEKPISESSSFSVYGDINELAKRINASLIRSGLSALERKYVGYPSHPSVTVPYLSYEQWNMMNVNPYPLIGDVFINAAQMMEFYSSIFRTLGGDYNRYLMEYIYENENGVYSTVGYKCVLGTDKKGEMVSSEEKLMTFDGNSIYEALQTFNDVFELQYYVTKEKDGSGGFTGNTLIVVADCEYDFADIDTNGYHVLVFKPSDWESGYQNYYEKVNGSYVSLSEETDFVSGVFYASGDYERDSEGIPMSSSPFDYGAEDELLFKEKTNTTDKIVTRITGVGSSENIPWYYPNPNPDGWIKPIFTRDGVIHDSITIEYPTDEGSTVAQSSLYEKYLKNRIGNSIKRGKLWGIILDYEYTNPSIVTIMSNPVTYGYKCEYFIPDKESFAQWSGLTAPRMTMLLSYLNDSNCDYFTANLYDISNGNTLVGTYSSNQTYDNPTAFQTMCMNRNGHGATPLNRLFLYKVVLMFVLPYKPLSKMFDYEGYYYDARTISYSGPTEPYYDEQGNYHIIVVDEPHAYVGDNFYSNNALTAYAQWEASIEGHDDLLHDHMRVVKAGYSSNGESSGHVSPISRYRGKQYRDIGSGTIYLCENKNGVNIHNGQNQNAFVENPYMGVEEWVRSYLSMKIRLHDNDGWYIGTTEVQLSDYGLGDPVQGGETYDPVIGDAIEFQRTKYVTPQQNLMPEVYVKTDGERRYYNAHNYWDKENETLYVGTADRDIGETQVGTKVRNAIYKENETDTDDKHYDFENEYMQRMPHEHIENFEDEKPTISEQKNFVHADITQDVIDDWANQYGKFYTRNGDGTFSKATSTYDPGEEYYVQIRLDVVELFGYDLTDNDEVWEDNGGGGSQGEYKHPYFFAKLRPLGFNIFDLALQDDMVLSITTGDCGACKFKIGVDENTKKNPVQIWEYDVYEGTWSGRVLVYKAGSLRRYVDLTNLYYDTNEQESGYTSLVSGLVEASEATSSDGQSSSVDMYKTYTYSAEDVANGMVGSMRKGGDMHFEGDVVTSGRYIESQQDTTDAYVWVALMKDTETYGTIMPSARPDYNDHNYDFYTRPKSIGDVHTDTSTNEDDEKKADKFVLTNIRLPQMYLRRAEHNLSRDLVGYMYDHNYQKFNFSIRFSRIFIEENSGVDDNMNENSVLYVNFNKKAYRQYVKHYTYKMSHDAPLPETTVEMNEELSVGRTTLEKWRGENKKEIYKVSMMVGATAQQVEDRMDKKNKIQNENTLVAASTVVQKEKYKYLEWGEF